MLAIGLKSFSIQNVFLHRKKDLLVIIIIQVGVGDSKEENAQYLPQDHRHIMSIEQCFLRTGVGLKRYS